MVHRISDNSLAVARVLAEPHRYWPGVTGTDGCQYNRKPGSLGLDTDSEPGSGSGSGSDSIVVLNPDRTDMPVAAAVDWKDRSGRDMDTAVIVHMVASSLTLRL